MRNLTLLDAARITDPRMLAYSGGWAGDETCGAFIVKSPTDGQALRVIASSGEGWDHVSVSRATRCPNWPEMCAIKELFFKDDETAMQLHPPRSDWVNNHQFCLHLWRPHGGDIPRPPSIMVGIKDAGVIKTPEDAMALRRAMERGDAA